MDLIELIQINSLATYVFEIHLINCDCYEFRTQNRVISSIYYEMSSHFYLKYDDFS